MATGEDQAQAIVGDLVGIVVWFNVFRAELAGVGFDFFLKVGLPTNAIDGLIAGGLNDPGSRVFGNSGGWPLIEGDGKGFLGNLFGKVEVTDQSDERGDDASPIGAVNCFYGLGGI